jgi:hypothetical protein
MENWRTRCILRFGLATMCIELILDLWPGQKVIGRAQVAMFWELSVNWVFGPAVDMRSGCVQAEAAPRLGDDDAVAGIAGIEADLDGEVDADVANVIAEGGYVLGALVGYSGYAIAIDEDTGGRGWAVSGGIRQPVGFSDAAVRDAADPGEVVAASAFDLRWGGSAASEEISGDASDGRRAEADGDQVPRVTEEERQMGWNVRRHGLWAKHSLLR